MLQQVQVGYNLQKKKKNEPFSVSLVYVQGPLLVQLCSFHSQPCWSAFSAELERVARPQISLFDTEVGCSG